MLPESPSSVEPGHPHQGPGSFSDFPAASVLRQPGARLTTLGAPFTLTLSVRAPGIPLVLPPPPCHPFLTLHPGPDGRATHTLGAAWPLEGDSVAAVAELHDDIELPWFFPPAHYKLIRGKDTAITAISVSFKQTHMTALAAAYPERVVRLFLPRRSTCVLRLHPSRLLTAWIPLP